MLRERDTANLLAVTNGAAQHATASPTAPLTIRPRRLRRTPTLRAMVRETQLAPDDFIYPLFITHGRNVRTPIGSMPGVFQLSVDQLTADAWRACGGALWHSGDQGSCWAGEFCR